MSRTKERLAVLAAMHARLAEEYKRLDMRQNSAASLCSAWTLDEIRKHVEAGLAPNIAGYVCELEDMAAGRLEMASTVGEPNRTWALIWHNEYASLARELTALL